MTKLKLAKGKVKFTLSSIHPQSTLGIKNNNKRERKKKKGRNISFTCVV